MSKEMADRARVLVLEAGSPPAANLIRSLRHGAPSLVIVGCDDDPFALKKSAADRKYALPLGSQDYPKALRRIIRKERIDLVIPTSDGDALRLAGLRSKLECRTFLPRRSVIERCHDKYVITRMLRRHGIPAPLTYRVANVAELEDLFERFRPRRELWCRMRAGSGSFAAIPVKTPEQARSWIEYWERMRGVPTGSFTLSEYLPGRDYCVQSLWDRGTLVLVKMAERITYLDTSGPSGVSSMPALAKTFFDRRILGVCKKAMRALDPGVSGAFFIDVKENESGEPCITEINAGRLATMTNIHDLVGQHNMAVTLVRLGLGERVRFPKPVDFAEGYYLVRSVDTVPAIVHKDELFENVDQLR